MSYQRPKSNISMSKPEKVNLMAEYITYYEGIVNTGSVDALNVKIPREAFAEILDSIGETLNQAALKMSEDDGPVKDFLKANPLPPNMKDLLPDDFRVFSLLLNSLKQWVSAESAATDRYLLGVTARATCRAATKKCIVTGQDLGDDAELHHPVRDGRPPILISKEGHSIIEGQVKSNKSITNFTS
ncbi:MAG: hypothetical protein WCG21_03530 [Eubacteriales bacterium]